VLQEAAMDALKVIPQVFFDLIARVVPGTVAIILISIALPQDTWSGITQFLKDDAPKVITDSATLWVLTLIELSYVVGHLLSPISKMLEKTVDDLLASDGVIKKLFSDKPGATPELVEFIKKQLGNPTSYQEYFEDELWIWYDWLRLFNPDAGSLTARIRSEYAMYYALSIAFALALGIYLYFEAPVESFLFLFTVGISLFLLVRAIRWLKTEWTFKLSVRNFYILSIVFALAFDVYLGLVTSIKGVFFLFAAEILILLLVVRGYKSKRTFKLSVRNFYYVARRQNVIVANQKETTGS
jgi:hypothetical protein